MTEPIVTMRRPDWTNMVTEYLALFDRLTVAEAEIRDLKARLARREARRPKARADWERRTRNASDR